MIKIENRQLCESCFSEVKSFPCPVCGFLGAEHTEDTIALPCGTVLDNRYVIGRFIGKGGFGITYLAYDKQTNNVIVVKEYYPMGIAYRSSDFTITLTDEKSESIFRKGAEKFYEESKLVSQFNGNPNIVSVYDVFRANDTVYLTMEYLEGITLKEHIIKNGVISEEAALKILDKITLALEAAHSRNVLHRDISPDNIMLCNDGRIVLIDFGAARQVIAESELSLSVVFKPGYTPVEQYTKRGKQGPWTDIYALGATIFFALTGEEPDTPYERMENDSGFSFNKYGISDGLWRIIKKSLMIKRENRYTNVSALRKELTPDKNFIKIIACCCAVAVIAAVCVGAVMTVRNSEKESVNNTIVVEAPATEVYDFNGILSSNNMEIIRNKVSAFNDKSGVNTMIIFFDAYGDDDTSESTFISDFTEKLSGEGIAIFIIRKSNSKFISKIKIYDSFSELHSKLSRNECKKIQNEVDKNGQSGTYITMIEELYKQLDKHF